ncbi:Hypothetical protein HVR_LOCUS885 [uncultured virus]|nr:Hypothetical protein HVR_LOCUS885 [uncultured virus]
MSDEHNCSTDRCSVNFKLGQLYARYASGVYNAAESVAIRSGNADQTLAEAKDQLSSLLYYLSCFMEDEPRVAIKVLYLAQIESILALVALYRDYYPDLPPAKEVLAIEEGLILNASQIAEIFIEAFPSTDAQRARDINEELAKYWIFLSAALGRGDFPLAGQIIDDIYNSYLKFSEVIGEGISA